MEAAILSLLGMVLAAVVAMPWLIVRSLDETNARIDITNDRIDETNTRIDETNTKIGQLTDSVHMLSNRVSLLESRREDRQPVAV